MFGYYGEELHFNHLWESIKIQCWELVDINVSVSSALGNRKDGAALNMSSFVVKQWDIFSSFVKRMQNSNMLSDSLRGTEVVTSWKCLYLIPWRCSLPNLVWIHIKFNSAMKLGISIENK